MDLLLPIGLFLTCLGWTWITIRSSRRNLDREAARWLRYHNVLK